MSDKPSHDSNYEELDSQLENAQQKGRKSFRRIIQLPVFVSLFLVAATLGIFLLNKEPVYTIDEPYVYPINTEWEQLEDQEAKIAACQIPEDILKDMTTSALLSTVLDYPLNYGSPYVDTTTDDLSSKIFYSVLKSFNGLQNLVERNDVVDALKTELTKLNVEFETYQFGDTRRFLALTRKTTLIEIFSYVVDQRDLEMLDVFPEYGFTPTAHPAYKINEPYIFPESEKTSTKQIPEDILENMTTRALILTVLNSGILDDIYGTFISSYSYNPNEAFNDLTDTFNGLQELMKRDDTLTVLASELDQLMNSSALFENELLRIDTYTPEDRALIQRRRDLLILLAGIADYHGYDGIALQMFYRVTYASSALEETQVITSGTTP